MGIELKTQMARRGGTHFKWLSKRLNVKLCKCVFAQFSISAPKAKYYHHRIYQPLNATVYTI